MLGLEAGGGSVLTIDKIDSDVAFAEIKPEWDRLFSLCSHRNPFLSHAWMTSWWRHFGGGRELCVLVLRSDGEVVLIAPLMRYRGRLYDRFPPLPVTLIESLADYYSNRVDFLYRELKEEYLRLILDYLVDMDRWQVLRIYPLLADSDTTRSLQHHTERRGWRLLLTSIGDSPYMPLVQDQPLSKQVQSSELRRKMRWAHRLVERGEVDVEFYTKKEELGELLPVIFEIADKGWAFREGTAISSTPALKGFYTEVAQFGAEYGWFFATVLRAESQAIAFEYNLVFEGILYNLKVGFDPAFSRYSPGFLLKYLTLVEAARRVPGLTEMDMLGVAEPYKRKWTSQSRSCVKANIYHPRSLYARCLYHLQNRYLQPLKKALDAGDA